MMMGTVMGMEMEMDIRDSSSEMTAVITDSCGCATHKVPIRYVSIWLAPHATVDTYRRWTGSHGWTGKSADLHLRGDGSRKIAQLFVGDQSQMPGCDAVQIAKL